MFQTTITNTRASERIVSEQESFSWLEIFRVNREAWRGREGKGKSEIIFYLFPASEHEERKKKAERKAKPAKGRE